MKSYIIFGVIAWFTARSLFGCHPALTAQDDAELGEYKAQLSACLVAHPSNKPAQDQCIEQVQKDWAARWNARFDGGFGG